MTFSTKIVLENSAHYVPYCLVGVIDTLRLQNPLIHMHSKSCYDGALKLLLSATLTHRRHSTTERLAAIKVLYGSNHFPFFFVRRGVWAKSEAAARFSNLVDFELLSTRLAAVAAFLLVGIETSPFQIRTLFSL